MAVGFASGHITSLDPNLVPYTAYIPTSMLYIIHIYIYTFTCMCMPVSAVMCHVTAVIL